MDRAENSSIVLIFGRKGTGKTTLLRKCLDTIRGKKCILIIDLLDKFGDIADETFKTVFQYIYYMEEYDYEGKILRLNSTDKNNIIATIGAAYQYGNTSIFMDEADHVFSRNMSKVLSESILRGRNQGIDFVFSTLRPHKLNVDVRNQADIVYSFSLNQKDAIQAVCDEFGNDKLEPIIKQLTGHDYMKYYVDTEEIVLFRDRMTYGPVTDITIGKGTGKKRGPYKKKKKQKNESKIKV